MGLGPVPHFCTAILYFGRIKIGQRLILLVPKQYNVMIKNIINNPNTNLEKVIFVPMGAKAVEIMENYRIFQHHPFFSEIWQHPAGQNVLSDINLNL